MTFQGLWLNEPLHPENNLENNFAIKGYIPLS